MATVGPQHQKKKKRKKEKKNNTIQKHDFEASLFIIMTMLHSFPVGQNSTAMRMKVCNTAAKRWGKRVVRDVSKVQK